MSNIKGTIINIKDFLCKSAVDIKINNSKSEDSFQLEEDRKYVIPDFQREIRWTSENLIELINDINNSDKFLGNIILTKKKNKSYDIIDGQQRTTLLLMLVMFSSITYKDELPKPCALCEFQNDSFPEFWNLLCNGFDIELSPEIIKNDKYGQLERYTELWRTIKSAEIFSNSLNARKFIKNLERCELNIILSEEDSTGYSIEYFLDVNLKGVKLDTEDIFKGYLFYLDPSPEIRTIWVKLKEKASNFNKLCNAHSKAKTESYPLMKMIEHYFYCDLYNNEKYNSVDFGEDFCLRQSVTIDGYQHYIGEHILKVINSNRYFQESLNKIIIVIDILTNIIENEYQNDKFKSLFKVRDDGVDNVETAIFFKIIKLLILNRTSLISKALIMKYIISSFLCSDDNKKKETFRNLYSLHAYITFFNIYENKKGIDVISKILKSTQYPEEISSYLFDCFDLSTVFDRRRNAEFKYSTKPDTDEQRFHSISLASIYNYFEFINGVFKVKHGKMNELNDYLYNSNSFSVEHFVINDSGKCLITMKDSNNCFEYQYSQEIKKYASSIFNFIFIPQKMNESLGNLIVNDKLEMISEDNVECEYSKEIIKLARKYFCNNFTLKSENKKENHIIMDKYFSYEFKQSYENYVKEVISIVINRFPNKH